MRVFPGNTACNVVAIFRAIAHVHILATGEGFATPAAGFQAGSKESRAFDLQLFRSNPRSSRSAIFVTYLLLTKRVNSLNNALAFLTQLPRNDACQPGTRPSLRRLCS